MITETRSLATIEVLQERLERFSNDAKVFDDTELVAGKLLQHIRKLLQLPGWIHVVVGDRYRRHDAHCASWGYPGKLRLCAEFKAGQDNGFRPCAACQVLERSIRHNL